MDAVWSSSFTIASESLDTLGDDWSSGRVARKIPRNVNAATPIKTAANLRIVECLGNLAM
ncbi:hypothetical protein IJG29_00615 [Candidatus Saccharibacteria bacterium]|nr:hypothetical protein [Candidatus Saccharibacteria bacterium]